MSAASGAACRVCGGGVEDCACLLQRGRGAAGMRCGVADLNRSFPVGMFVQAAEEPAVVDVASGGGAAAVGLQEFQFFGQEDQESVAWLFNDHTPVGGEDRLQHRPAATEHQQSRQAFDAYAEYQPGHGLTFDVPVMLPLSRGVDVAAGLGLGGGHPVTSGATIVSGWTGLFCPCVLFGRNVQAIREDIPWTTPCTCHAVCVEGGIALAILTAIFHGVDPGTSVLIGEGLVFSWWLCSTYTGIFRQQLQKKYHLKNAPCDPCLVHCCFHWCANCQEHRERKGRLADNSAVPMTIVNPPPVQEMSTVENHASTSENEAPKAEHDDVEVIPL